MTNKDFFKTVNTIAQENFDMAKGMLVAFNLMNGTGYEFINKRVCYETTVNGVKRFHDAWVNA